MKKLIYISLIGFLLITGCKKDKPVLTVATLPFETDDIKMESVGSFIHTNLTDIFFLNASIGFMVSYDGEIYKTTDNGVSWNLKYTNPTANQPFYQILFVDENLGYVVGGSASCGGTGCSPSGGIILKTIDGGNTWSTVLTHPSVEFVSIAVNSLTELFAITKSQIYKSTNAGINWVNIDSNHYSLNKINFNGSFGFCTGNGGKIIRSIDNGATWSSATTLAAYYATDIKFKSENGYCLANNQDIYKTDDNGENWIPTLNASYTSYVLNPLTENSCLAFGAGVSDGGLGLYDGRVTQTTNGGSVWTTIEIRDILAIQWTSFYSATEGYAVSADGKLIRVTVK